MSEFLRIFPHVRVLRSPWVIKESATVKVAHHVEHRRIPLNAFSTRFPYFATLNHALTAILLALSAPAAAFAIHADTAKRTNWDTTSQVVFITVLYVLSDHDFPIPLIFA